MKKAFCLALACATSPASAQNLSVEGLMTACVTEEAAWQGFCDGYMQAAFDSWDFAFGNLPLCLPDGTTRADLSMEFLRRAVELEGALPLDEMDAMSFLAAIWSGRYPCD